MLRALDRHSAFFTSDEFKRFFFDLNREYGGIGAFVNFDQDDVFSIVRPIYSGPGLRAGLRSGDKILKVDGWETGRHTSDEIISRLKGAPDTPVVVKRVPPRHGTAREDHDRPRADPGALGQRRDPAGQHRLRRAGDLQHQHRRGAAPRAAQSVREKGVEGLVLDVRSNTGGYLVAGARTSSSCSSKVRRESSTPKGRTGVNEAVTTPATARWLPDAADGRAGERVLGIGVGDRRRRAAGPESCQ